MWHQGGGENAHDKGKMQCGVKWGGKKQVPGTMLDGRGVSIWPSFRWEGALDNNGR